MNHDTGLRAGKRQVLPRKDNGPDADSLIIAALGFFANAPEEAQRFFSWSGIEPPGLRAAAGETGFIVGLLDYFAQNLPSLERFGEAAGVDPGAVIRLHETHRVAGLTSHDDI